MKEIMSLRERAWQEYIGFKAQMNSALEQVKLLDRLIALREGEGRKRKKRATISEETRERMRKAARARWKNKVYNHNKTSK